MRFQGSIRGYLLLIGYLAVGIRLGQILYPYLSPFLWRYFP